MCGSLIIIFGPYLNFYINKVLGMNEQVLKLLEEKNVLKMNLEFSLKETDVLKDKLKRAEEKIDSLSVFLNCYFYILNNPINLQTLRSNLI